MTSTGFTVGLDGSRVSSKVLKPPGGGSSDIFGLGNSQLPVLNGGEKKNKEPETTQSRLFGGSDSFSSTTKANRMQSSVFANEIEVTPRSIKKRYVHRNPITGEEIEFNPEKCQQVETNGEENDKDEIAEEKEIEVPSVKPVQTSIRVRNPPGGKSSGIF